MTRTLQPVITTGSRPRRSEETPARYAAVTFTTCASDQSRLTVAGVMPPCAAHRTRNASGSVLKVSATAAKMRAFKRASSLRQDNAGSA